MHPATEPSVRAMAARGLGDRLACPACGRTLEVRAEGLACSGCGTRIPVSDPVVLVPELDAFKRAQAAAFDAEDREFETARPNGAPRIYSWMYAEKFRRGTRALRMPPPVASALVVCGGSGMDAEFLVRAGVGFVVTSDISVEACRRARDRARRFGLAYEVVVADAERLPFRDRAFDLVYVHDGLHHLERPLDGLREMLRIARRAVSVNEPARALVTRAAVRLGLALEVEPAGNPVARLSLDELTVLLERSGFDVVHAERYPMWFRHVPGRISRALSLPGAFTLARIAYRGMAAVAGPIGNKLSVEAVRRGDWADTALASHDRRPEGSNHVDATK